MLEDRSLDDVVMGGGFPGLSFAVEAERRDTGTLEPEPEEDAWSSTPPGGHTR